MRYPTFSSIPHKARDIVEMNAGITYVGKTSIDLLINVNRLDETTQECKHVTTAYFTYVRVDPQGNKKEMPRYVPQTPHEIELWNESVRRREDNLLVMKLYKVTADSAKE